MRGSAPSGPGAGSGRRPLRLGLFGGAQDTGNLGVSALGASAVHGLLAAERPVELTLFDHGRGRGPLELGLGERTVSLRRVGCAYSRRLYRPGNLQQLRAAARLGLRRLQPVLREIGALDAILDVSGGDSFSDLYGDWRFRAVAAPKQLARALGLPLVLLPQTYGPWVRPRNRAAAARILREARMAWARDERSLRVVRDLLGEGFDPARHRLGVDMAFGLPPRPPAEPALRGIGARAGGRDGLLVGLNVSGLLYHAGGAERQRFGLRARYRELVTTLLERLLEEPELRVLLVPHVVPPCRDEEADERACAALREAVAGGRGERVEVARGLRDPGEAKWLIGCCDVFCGTRMHACIAGLSQGVPTVGLAYSDKAKGVFEAAGAAGALLDLRRLEGEEVWKAVLDRVARRAELAAALRAARAPLEARLDGQLRAVVRALAPDAADARAQGEVG